MVDVAQGLDLFGARRALAQMLFTPSDFFEFRCKRRGIPERPREALVSKNKRVVGWIFIALRLSLPSEREYKKYREEQLRASWQRDGSENHPVFLFFSKNRVERERGGREKNGEKVGRKRTCGGRAREKVRQREGERGWSVEKERDREIEREVEENTERCLRGWSINIGSRGWNWGSRVGRVRGRTVVLLRLPPLSYGIRRMADITTWYRQWRIAHGP